MHLLELDPNNNVIGVRADIINELAKRLGIKASHQICPFKRCIRKLYKGELDVMVFLGVTPERAEYIEPIQIWNNPTPIRFLVRQEDYDKLQQFEDLYNFKIGAVYGYVYSPRMDYDRNLDLQLIQVEEQLPKMLQAGRIDTFPSYGSSLQTLNSSYSGITLSPLTLDQWDTALVAISKNSSLRHRKAEITRILEEMVRDGSLDNIWGRYFPGQKMPIPQATRNALRLSTP